MMYLVKVVVAGLCLAQVTNAASVRTSNKASVAALSNRAAQAALASLAAKYNCDEGGASLVTTLMRVAIENKAANESLTQTCREQQRAIASQLQGMLAAADTMENEEAPARALGVFNAAMKVANETFSGIDATHSDRVAVAATSAAQARVNMEEADAMRAAEVKKKMEAEYVYQDVIIELAENLRGQTSTFNLTRSVRVTSAKTALDRELAAAAHVKEMSDLNCKKSYDARMALVTKDEETIQNEIKPLLDQLQTCAVPSVPASGSDGGNFLETSAAKKAAPSRTRGGAAHKAQCSAVRRKLKAKMLLLETSTRSAPTAADTPADTPAQAVTGNMGDWANRVEAEKTAASTVRKSCEGEASGILDDVTNGLNSVFNTAKTEADKAYSDRVEKVTAELEAQKIAAKAVADATLAPAAQAVAEFETAKNTFDEKDAAHAAAKTTQGNALVSARALHVKAENEARQAQADTEKTVKDEAESLRILSKKDANLKAANKKAECSSEIAALEGELRVIASIKQKLATLTTVNDDALGQKAEAEAADFKLRLQCTTHCHNGACKMAADKKYHCNCDDGWKGVDCGSSIDKCQEDSNACNDGACTPTGPGKFECDCTLGFDGDVCQNNIDDCASTPCGDHGQCLDGVDEYSCICHDGYEGDNCDHEIQTCAHNPCENGGTCTDGPVQNGVSYTCACPSTYTGPTCAVDVNECTTGVCQHGSTCHNVQGGHTCTCSTFYEGTNCETPVNFCPSHCAASPKTRTCASRAGNYPVCHCHSDYKGTTCSTKKIIPRVVSAVKSAWKKVKSWGWRL